MLKLLKILLPLADLDRFAYVFALNVSTFKNLHGPATIFASIFADLGLDIRFARTLVSWLDF
jgi:hypothetical protein